MSEMTRRDTLAAAVAGHIWAQFQDDGTASEHPEWRHGVAIEAYRLADEMIEVGDRHVKPPTPHQWQPIDTAPRDGTYVLLLGTAGRMADGKWVARYGAWSWPYVLDEPTHWMPLPPEPKEQT